MAAYKNVTTSLVEDIDVDESDSSVDEDDTELNGDNDSESSQNDDKSNDSESSKNDDKSNDSESSKNDDKSNDEASSEDDNDENENAGWADSIAKILKSSKPKGKRSLVLSRAKKISDIKKKKTETTEFEVIGEVKEEKLSAEELLKLSLPGEDEDDSKNKKRGEDLPNFRVKPNILEKEREKILSKIATRGVVQLFNAVRNQQKDIEYKMAGAGSVERKKDKIIKSMDKTQFLDKLMGGSKSDLVNAALLKKEEKEIKKEESTWNVFRDDFMMGAKMKDWDKNEKTAETKTSDFSESDSE